MNRKAPRPGPEVGPDAQQRSQPRPVPRPRPDGQTPATNIGVDLSRVSCLGEALRVAIPAAQSRDAFIEADRRKETSRFTFREVSEGALRVLGALQAGGVEKGDRVAMLASNQSRWPVSAIAALWAGAILVPLDYKLTGPEQAALLGHAAPKVLITEWAVWRTLRSSLKETASNAPASAVPWVVVIDAPEGADLSTAHGTMVSRWELLRSRTAPTPVDPERDDVCCIVYSSGTGGDIKGCQLTHGNYLHQAEVLSELFPMVPGERYFSVLPTNHAIDFMCGFVLPMLFGATVVHQRTLRPEFLSWTMKRYGVTHMALVPAILSRLKTRLEERFDALPSWKRAALDAMIRANEIVTLKSANHKMSSRLLKPVHDEFGGKLRYIFAGGAFVDPEVAEFFYRLGIPIVIGYGLTEAGTVLTVNDLEPFRSDTVGKPVRGTTIEIRDADESGVGEVWATGPTLMAGYVDAPELTNQSLVEGWLHTGDRGRFDAAGHLKLLGRSRNMIVTGGGKNVYPEDVEGYFDGAPGVEELCVFASGFVWSDTALADERLLLVVRLKDDANAANVQAELHGRARKLADYKRPTHVVWWSDEMPRTASMKLKRRALAESLRERDATMMHGLGAEDAPNIEGGA
jgi:long-chain acyl-CoA synthetase